MNKVSQSSLGAKCLLLWINGKNNFHGSSSLRGLPAVLPHCLFNPGHFDLLPLPQAVTTFGFRWNDLGQTGDGSKQPGSNWQRGKMTGNWSRVCDSPWHYEEPQVKPLCITFLNKNRFVTTRFQREDEDLSSDWLVWNFIRTFHRLWHYRTLIHHIN